MREFERIADQLQRAFAGPAWHGSSLLELLNGVTASRAAAQPVADAHSVWEIVAHIAAWDRAARLRLAGERAEFYNTKFDWPAVNNASDAAWQEMLKQLTQAHDELRQAILALDDARLDEPILEGMSSVYATLHGVIQHDLYHAGQIAVLLKATAAPRGND